MTIGHHDGSDHPLTQPLVGEPEHRAVGHRRVGPQRGLHGLRQHGQPARADRLVGSAQHAEYARIINSANIIGAKPARLGERVGIGWVAIAVGQCRAADHDPAVGVHPQPHPVERNTVVHTAAGGFAHPVGADHRDTRARGGVQDRSRGRPAADQHGVQLGQRRSGRRIGQRLGQLRGHQCRVAATGAEFALRQRVIR